MEIGFLLRLSPCLSPSLPLSVCELNACVRASVRACPCKNKAQSVRHRQHSQQSKAKQSKQEKKRAQQQETYRYPLVSPPYVCIHPAALSAIIVSFSSAGPTENPLSSLEWHTSSQMSKSRHVTPEKLSLSLSLLSSIFHSHTLSLFLSISPSSPFWPPSVRFLLRYPTQTQTPNPQLRNFDNSHKPNRCPSILHT